MPETILFLAHAEPGAGLAKPALEALECARTLSQGTFVAGLVGESEEAACQLAGAGAARVWQVAGAEFAVPRYSTDTAAAEAICRAAGASVIIAAGTLRWARALPGVAARLHGRADSHATAVSLDAATSVTRWFYRQRMEGVLRREQRPWFILIEPGSGPAWQGEQAEAPVEVLDVPVATRTTVVGVQAPSAGQQTIRPDASLLFVAGAGWTKKQPDGQPHVEDASRLILEFLALAQASLGSSKSLVDLSGEGQAVLPFLTHLNQVGQTGSTPRHAKGLSTCCHGEEPHAVGWRFIGERRAINMDPNCGWARGKADVVYVADAFAVMAQVNELLRARGSLCGAGAGTILERHRQPA
jgi:electron transfer flavoprotein alpha subunit